MTIRELTLDDYNEVYALWQRTEGMGLSSADERDKIAGYLVRNPGLSLVACQGSLIVGTILGGHDGRRGYIHHLAVEQTHRGSGVGRALVESCLTRLSQEGIEKCHVFVYGKNAKGRSFWRSISWQQRDELVLYSRELAKGRLTDSPSLNSRQ